MKAQFMWGAGLVLSLLGGQVAWGTLREHGGADPNSYFID